MNTIPDILATIIVHKQSEVQEAQSAIPLAQLQARMADMPPTRGFEQALRSTVDSGKTAVIAEIKKGSPSRGVIRAGFDPLAIARSYQENGATCLSVLTDQRFFLGHLEYLTDIRAVVSLPLLRKDFICDPYQIYEARAAGADAILLIAAMLEVSRLQEYHTLAKELNMDVLLEVHDEAEMERALMTDCTLIGVNNRDLRTFTMDLGTTGRLARMLPPERLLVAESGIHNRQDIDRLAAAGAKAYLIGEALMREDDCGNKLRRLIEG